MLARRDTPEWLVRWLVGRSVGWWYLFCFFVVGLVGPVFVCLYVLCVCVCVCMFVRYNKNGLLDNTIL